MKKAKMNKMKQSSTKKLINNGDVMREENNISESNPRRKSYVPVSKKRVTVNVKDTTQGHKLKYV